MVYFVGVAAALALGLGYVVQQRVASTMPIGELLRWQLLFGLMRQRLWWFGIGAMVVGQALAGYALSLAAVATVEPLLSANLLFALAFAAGIARQRIRWQEVAGAVLLSAALAVFIEVGDPHDSPAPDTSNVAITAAVAAVVVSVLALVAVARQRGLVGESVLLATGAGLLYGLQDAATRAAFIVIDDRGIADLAISPWTYIVVGSAAVGILLSQSAFKAARLDYSLPPIAAAEPVAGIALGIGLLGDVVSLSVLGIVAESLCLVAMIAGAALIGRSPNLAAQDKR
ncbi:MAG TPA: DMT family transporter [Jatrophihabitantaceae bacterium]|nr:DMT family transporter [Jatrophihabitantaceae bacterium]